MGKHKPLKLAVFVDQIFWFDGRAYFTDEAFIKYIMAFNAHFGEIIFYTRVADEWVPQEYRLPPEKVVVHRVPWYERVFSLGTRWPAVLPVVARTFVKTKDQWDLAWLFMPHPISLFLAELCRWNRKPFFMTVRQNMMEMVRQQNRGMKRAAALAVVGLMEARFRALTAVHPTFAVGDELYRAYKRNANPVYPSTVSLISNRDIVPLAGAAAADSRKVNLFSVGRLSAEKGLLYLIQAVDELVNRAGMDVTLRMGGKGAEEDSLKQEVARRGLEERVQFLGYIPDGELLAAYRASDVFMLPSLTEGLPQALLEAMACGVPVVASRVGGVPQLITDGENGLLVNPTDASQLTRAVCQLVGDRALRERIRENGVRTAREHTIEAEVARVVAVLRDCFPTLSF